MEAVLQALKDYWEKIGLAPQSHLLLHAAFRRIRAAFPGISPQILLESLQSRLLPGGSLIMPAFSYTFEKSKQEVTPFSRQDTRSAVGAVSEYFRRMPGVTRTASATHSFAFCGRIADEFDAGKTPTSPLGKDSVLDWLARRDKAWVLLLGCDFTSLSFGHWLETQAPVPWSDTFCWHYLDVRPLGLSEAGRQKLREVPGCSKSFIRFEEYLLDHKLLHPLPPPMQKGYLLRTSLLVEEGLPFFRNNAHQLLCKPGSCAACDERWFSHIDELRGRMGGG